MLCLSSSVNLMKYVRQYVAWFVRGSCEALLATSLHLAGTTIRASDWANACTPDAFRKTRLESPKFLTNQIFYLKQKRATDLKDKELDDSDQFNEQVASKRLVFTTDWSLLHQVLLQTETSRTDITTKHSSVQKLQLKIGKHSAKLILITTHFCRRKHPELD